MEIKLLDISAVLGLCAMISLTVNALLGMLLSTAYKTTAQWKKMPATIKRISLLQLHNWTAYIALLLVLLHPLLLILDANTHFAIQHIVFPLDAPKQPIIVMLGTISLFAFILVIITTQKAIKKRMSFRLWKNIHLISYLTALLFIVHGLLMDPLLKDRPTDWFDGEKLLCELCGLILITATFLRARHQTYKRKPI
jgi:sulfoxide reductase heme-binding subunit YedZ